MFRIFAVGLLLAGCELSFSAMDSVEIPGNGSIEEKMKVAKEVASALWEGPLKTNILSEVDGISKEELENGLGLQWKKFTYKSFTDDSQSGTKIQLVCSFKANSSSNKANEVVASCKSQVEKALIRRIGASLN